MEEPVAVEQTESIEAAMASGRCSAPIPSRSSTPTSVVSGLHYRIFDDGVVDSMIRLKRWTKTFPGGLAGRGGLSLEVERGSLSRSSGRRDAERPHTLKDDQSDHRADIGDDLGRRRRRRTPPSSCGGPSARDPVRFVVHTGRSPRTSPPSLSSGLGCGPDPEASLRIVELVAARDADRYPSELSGGQQQRVGVAGRSPPTLRCS